MTNSYANPIDIPYRLQELSVGPFYRRVFREAADPSLVMFEGTYFLFPSMSGGFFHSDDLLTWRFVETPTLPTYDYAPDVREIDGALVVCASKSTGTCSFFRSANPLAGEWEEIPGTFPFFDPNLFQDDDGRVYLFWGTSNKTPIWGQEIDRQTFVPIGERMPVIASDMHNRGWERTGEDFNPLKTGMGPIVAKFAGADPYIEGAWVTKHSGTYYLQYAGPGTQFNTYADGYYESKSPLGPYRYSPQSPFSSKPGGFMPGAGHGSTIADKHGNWWHLSTMRISVNHMFERRIGIWPAGFDYDGTLYCNQEFGDYPKEIPTGKFEPWSIDPKAMLLNYKTETRVSSALPEHPGQNAVDENCRTWWVPTSNQPGEWISVEIPTGSKVEYIQVNLAEHNLVAPRRSKKQKTRTLLWNRHIDITDPQVEFLLEGTFDGKNWITIEDVRGKNQSRTHMFIELAKPEKFTHIRLTGFRQPHGAVFAVSGLRVFGKGSGKAPISVVPKVTRTSELNALVKWNSDAGSQGYNVRYGTSPQQLYKSWLVHGRESLDLATLNSGVDYWVAVDSFNANGITRGKPVAVPRTIGDKNV